MAAPRLVYEPLTTSNIDKPGVVRGSTLPSRPTAFLAADGTTYMLHGNSRIKVLDEKGRDASARYRTWRRMREFHLLGSTGFQVADAADPGSIWDEDNAGGTPSWLDVPGSVFPVGGALPTEPERVMAEFAVAVAGDDGMPQGDILYFFIVTARHENRYRIIMSEGRTLSQDVWQKELLAKVTPYAEAAKLKTPVDSGWLVNSYATR